MAGEGQVRVGTNSTEIRRFSVTSTPPLRNLTARLPKNILACMADFSTSPRRKSITTQNLDEAKTAAYENDPQTELVILGSSENPAVTNLRMGETFLRKRADWFLKISRSSLRRFPDQYSHYRGFRDDRKFRQPEIRQP